MNFLRSVLQSLLALYGFAPRGTGRKRPSPIVIGHPRFGR